MVGQISPEEWLPADWTVEVRVRKNGKQDKSQSRILRWHFFSQEVLIDLAISTFQDLGVLFGKYYFDPSNGHKFNSKPEVLRYLKSIEINNSTPKKKRKHVSKQSTINSPAVAEQQKFGKTGENGQICNDQSSKLSGVERDEQNFGSTCTGDCMPLSEHTSEQCMEEANTLEVRDSEQREGKSDSTLSVCSSPAHLVGHLPENLPLENGVKMSEDDRKTQPGLNKLRQKKVPNLPRRASKRLAGVQADPEAELKYISPAHRVATRKPNEAKVSTSERYENSNTLEEHSGRPEAENDIDEKPSNTFVLSPNNNPSILEEHSGKIETECKADENPLDHLIMPPKNQSIPEEQSKKIETECKGDEKPLNPLIMPPENTRNTLVQSPNNPSTPEEHSRKIGIECKADEKPLDPLIVPPKNASTPKEDDIKADDDTRSSGDLWTDPCIEFAIKTLTGTISLEDEIKVDENPMPFQGLPFGDSWADPCIEFAVKTLTGEIPVGDDLGIQDYIQGQLSSSENGGNKGSTLPNNALDHFCQTNLVCQQFDAMDKPTLAPSGSFSLKNSGIAGDAQREKCYRERVL